MKKWPEWLNFPCTFKPKLPKTVKMRVIVTLYLHVLHLPDRAPVEAPVPLVAVDVELHLALLEELPSPVRLRLSPAALRCSLRGLLEAVTQAAFSGTLKRVVFIRVNCLAI